MHEMIVKYFCCDVCSFKSENEADVIEHEKSVKGIEIPEYLKNLKKGDEIYFISGFGISQMYFDFDCGINHSHNLEIQYKDSPKSNYTRKKELRCFDFYQAINSSCLENSVQPFLHCTEDDMIEEGRIWKYACMSFNLIPDPTLTKWWASLDKQKQDAFLLGIKSDD